MAAPLERPIPPLTLNSELALYGAVMNMIGGEGWYEKLVSTVGADAAATPRPEDDDDDDEEPVAPAPEAGGDVLDDVREGEILPREPGDDGADITRPKANPPPTALAVVNDALHAPPAALAAASPKSLFTTPEGPPSARAPPPASPAFLPPSQKHKAAPPPLALAARPSTAPVDIRGLSSG